MSEQPLVKEVRIVPVKIAPKCLRLHKLRRYRWDVTFYRPTEGDYPGVYDSRLHISNRMGYTFTAWGASLAAGRVTRKGLNVRE